MTTEHAWVDRDAYPFRSRWLELPEGKLHYIDEGEGEPLLFVHGTPTWSFEYRHLVRALRRGHRCIAVDHLGFGLSDRPANAAYTPEAHAERLRAFVDKLGLQRFTLVVHDFGGPIALPLVLDDPGRVARLVVLNSWMWSFADDPEMTKRARMVSGALGRFLYRRLNASLRMIVPSAYGDRRKLTKAIHAQYLAPFPDADGRERVLWALARALTGSEAFYDRLWQRRRQLAGVPTLIVWGLKDTAFRPHLLERWRRALPHASVVELAGAGHWPHEEEPDAVIAALEPFLAASSASGVTASAPSPRAAGTSVPAGSACSGSMIWVTSPWLSCLATVAMIASTMIVDGRPWTGRHRRPRAGGRAPR